MGAARSRAGRQADLASLVLEDEAVRPAPNQNGALRTRCKCGEITDSCLVHCKARVGLSPRWRGEVLLAKAKAAEAKAKAAEKAAEVVGRTMSFGRRRER